MYLRLTGYKRNSTILHYAAENGIKFGFDQLVSMLNDFTTPVVLRSDDKNNIFQDKIDKGIEIINTLFSPYLPLTKTGRYENISWQSQTDFTLQDIHNKVDFFIAIYKTCIQSKGKILNFQPEKESTLECRLGILIGNIPLLSIPLLIERLPEGVSRDGFIQRNKIEILPSKENLIPYKVSFAEEKLIPQDASPQLGEALKIKIFHPQNLSSLELRKILGLEISNEPIPDGVYLIRDDLGLGGVYVEGDLENLLLAIEEEYQVISFETKDGKWILKFSPSESKTIFSTPTECLFFNSSPLGIIIVNGEIHFLGGAIVDDSGEIKAIHNEETPSILRGLSLTIISSDKISLNTNLIHQGLEWKEGIPFVKDSESQLIIFATGKDFLDGTEKRGEISINESSPQEIKIQAELIASGNGFSIQGNEKKVLILGSLQTTNYISNDNSLVLKFDENFLNKEIFLNKSPKTIAPVVHFYNFKAVEWNDSNE